MQSLRKKFFPLIIEHVEAPVYLKSFQLDQASTLWNLIISDRHSPERSHSWQGIFTLQQLKDYINTCKIEKIDAKEIGYAIFNLDHEMVGTLHIHTMSWWARKSEVGYWLHFGFEGRGYINSALKLVENVFKETGFHRLEIRCNTKNLKSCQVAERAGFMREGTLREDEIENGAFRDTAIYGKLL